MFIPRTPLIKIGDRVCSTKVIHTLSGTFTPGHVFTIVGETHRGWVLKDDDGNGANDVGWAGFIKVGD
jgi:hypothetical protein